MALSSVIRKVGQGAGAVGKAVFGPEGLGVIQPNAPAPAAEPAAPAQAQAPTPFTLPELDPNDPDIEEKKAVHDAYTKLAAMFEESADADGIDYNAKYDELSKFAASRPQPRKWNPLASFAIALGSPGAGAAKVASDNEYADKSAREREDYLLNLKEAALKGQIAQDMEKGNFRKALQQSVTLAELNATLGRNKSEREGKQRLREIEETNKGKLGVANIKAAQARETMAMRVNSLASAYKLSADLRKSMNSLVSHYMSGLQSQKDAAGEPIYSRDQLEPLLEQLVGFAEDHSPIFVSETSTPTTAPTTPAATPPKAGTTVKVGGPKPDDDVAAAFARRKAARATK